MNPLAVALVCLLLGEVLLAQAVTTDHCAGKSCGNGICDPDSGSCQCFPGWQGHDCNQCGGKIRLNSTKGWLADAVGNYSVDSKCTWLIEGPETSSHIRLHLKEFATECGWDHLYIYDGDSVFSHLLAVYSGLVRHQRYAINRVPEIVGKSGSLLLHFYSDVAYNMTGFNITFNVDACPSQSHDQTCSGHGSCTSGQCWCDGDFKGPACDVPACPQNCAPGGNQRGKCNKNAKKCECYDGWTGESCSQEVDKGFWSVPSVDGSTSSRTSHASIVEPASGKVWIVGGETFSHSHRHMVATVEQNGDRLQWTEVRAHGERGPSPRYGHSAVVHDGKIYMYGGTMRSGHTSKELWSLDLLSLVWERVEIADGGLCREGAAKICGPIHSMGHTATVVSNNRMVVIFGHSPKYGYLDTVQEYHFGNKEWSIIQTKGFPVSGGFGHSAVWDDFSRKIFVYGGYVSTASTAAALSEDLYSYDPVYHFWTRHTSSQSFRYLHSAIFSHGLMIVFGGNTHNDTSWSQGAKCFSADLIVYDIVCDSWYSMEETIPKDLDADLPRFGHSAVMANGSMLIYGGFNGMLKSDILRYAPGTCEIYKTSESCLKSKAGQKCVWNNKKDICEILRPTMQKSSYDMCWKSGSNASADMCNGHKTCSACLSTSGDCVWCRDSGDSTEGQCSLSRCSSDKLKTETRLDQCPASEQSTKCDHLHTCHSCSAQSGCEWMIEKVSKCRPSKKSTGNLTDDPAKMAVVGGTGSTCGAACSERTSCSNCTLGLCMWCKNLNMCIDRNAYLASFPYGQCMDWTTQSDACPAGGDNATHPAVLCSDYKTCSSCRSNPSCGWCDDGSGTGLGSCHVGGASGPLKSSTVGLKHFTYTWEPDKEVCNTGAGKSWHFTSCPDCQCNGHSSCTASSDVCDADCQHNTEGDHCQRCTVGFFGNPVNGGSCNGCECNNQANTCNHRTGRCHCTTKGIIGDHCEKCDKQNHYFGDPMKASCFYDLAIDYQFTFNLSKPDDKHFTAINFKNIPTKTDVDVDFSISCSVQAKMNLSIKHFPEGGKDEHEDSVFAERNCTIFKNRFSKSDFAFGTDANLTFYVYVYDFKPPLWIIISFSQHPKLDLLQFFITFSVCFLALLLVAAVLWKIKQKYDRYRRRQRLFVEMEQMASRPFGSVFVDLEKVPDPVEGDTHVRKRKKQKHRPSPIALEPCLGNRAAVLSLIIRLPTGGKPYTPSGYTGIAVASSLVTLGNPRKTSSADPPNRQSIDTDSKGNRKGRKTSQTVADI